MGDAGGLRGCWARRRALSVARRADARESEPVVVAIFHTEAEARLAAGYLEGAGIPARVTLDQPQGFAGGITEAARVHVPRRLREAAESTLSEIKPGD